MRLIKDIDGRSPLNAKIEKANFEPASSLYSRFAGDDAIHTLPHESPLYALKTIHPPLSVPKQGYSTAISAIVLV
jgi:hypothetical protein